MAEYTDCSQLFDFANSLGVRKSDAATDMPIDFKCYTDSYTRDNFAR